MPHTRALRTPRVRALLHYVVASGVAACAASCALPAADEDPDRPVDDRQDDALRGIESFPQAALCDVSFEPGVAHCHARVRLHPDGGPFGTTVQGFTPADLRAAYALPASGGAGRVVAIVDAYDNPNAEKDLAVYRTQFGLPACTTANGCFRKVNQNGQQSSYPSPNAGWAGEIALDLDMASAACPDCKLLLVEASSASMTDLGTAVNTAVALGAAVVSNSWGGGESSSDPSLDTQYFNHPGVAITASAGDSGYGSEYPASSRFVTAVGGTSLVKSTSAARGWVEGVWGNSSNSNGGTGSGCSGVIAKPSWQKDATCGKRTVADVAAVADPNTGVAVYNTYQASGWDVYGGTSAAAPFVAATYALTGHHTVDGSFSYANPTAFFDVTSGTNGSCGGSYLCAAKVGYDGPTGNGTPNGAKLAGSTTPPPPPPPPMCTPACSGKQCGSDGCGGSCGSCASGATCNGSGQCVTSTPPPPPPPTSCAHALCATGGKLASTCDPCAQAICARDSYCCSTAWDAQCVGEVASICNKSCGGGTAPACAHPICTAGGKLDGACDSCASKICSADSYCCTTAWDSQCVHEVATICGQNC